MNNDVVYNRAKRDEPGNPEDRAPTPSSSISGLVNETGVTTSMTMSSVAENVEVTIQIIINIVVIYYLFVMSNLSCSCYYSSIKSECIFSYF